MTRSKSSRGRSARVTKPSGKLRIIAGQWRGRRLSVPNLPLLRPTGDRIRETLFNWLSSVIVGARCLDLFAGSGVLGFESSSRGAISVVLVDNNSRVVEMLRKQAQELEGDSISVVRANARQWLTQTDRSGFDVVFLDPPFDDACIDEVCKLLEETESVLPGGYVYIEQAVTGARPNLPENWQISQEKKAGRVRYYLARRSAPPHENNI